MNVTITFKNKVESYYTRADGSAALSKDVQSARRWMPS